MCVRTHALQFGVCCHHFINITIIIIFIITIAIIVIFLIIIHITVISIIIIVITYPCVVDVYVHFLIYTVFYQIHFLLEDRHTSTWIICFLCHYDFIFLKFITGCISFQKLDRKTADICVSWRPHRHIHIHPQTEIHVYVYINTFLSVYWEQTAYDFERMQPLKYIMENVLTCFMKVITKGVLY